MLRKLPARLYSIASSFRANSRRGRSADCRAALPGPQSRSPGHLLGPLRRAGRAGRLPAGLRALEPELPPAGRPGRADHHGRAGHGRGAVPGLRGGPRGERRRGQDVAVLRRPAFPHRFPLPGRMAPLAEAGRADAAGRGLLARPGPRRSTCSTACWRRAASCTAGCRKGPTSTSAAASSPMAADVACHAREASSRAKAARARKRPRPTWPACASRAATSATCIRVSCGVRSHPFEPIARRRPRGGTEPLRQPAGQETRRAGERQGGQQFPARHDPAIVRQPGDGLRAGERQLSC